MANISNLISYAITSPSIIVKPTSSLWLVHRQIDT